VATGALSVQFEDMSEVELDTHSAHAAEYFWWTCRGDIDSKVLLKSSLRDRLSSDSEADFAFGLFDLDGDGYVVEKEVHARFQKIYRCGLSSHCPNKSMLSA
jgi:hypothetical protein